MSEPPSLLEYCTKRAEELREEARLAPNVERATVVFGAARALGEIATWATMHADAGMQCKVCGNTDANAAWSDSWGK